MPRIYHSPSSVALGQRCERAWAYCYPDGLRLPPEIPWSAIEAGAEATSKQRACSLGKAVHEVFEAHYTLDGDRPDWESLPGQIAQTGLPFLPREFATAYVEEPIGDVPIDTPHGKPSVALEVHGVRWAGFKDLVVRGLDGRVTLYDYKTSSNVARWAKTADDLAADVQCNLYALDVMRRYSAQDKCPCRWVYMQTKGPRLAAPVDVTIECNRALEVLAPAAKLAKRLDTIPDSASAEPNTWACADYGGCPYHESAGGPCRARRSIGAMIQARTRRPDMAMKRSLREQFQKRQAEVEVAPPDDEAASEEQATPAETKEQATPPPARPRRRQKSKATAKSVASAIDGGESILAAVDELQDLTRRLVETEERINELRARIERAMNGA